SATDRYRSEPCTSCRPVPRSGPANAPTGASVNCPTPPVDALRFASRPRSSSPPVIARRVEESAGPLHPKPPRTLDLESSLGTPGSAPVAWKWHDAPGLPPCTALGDYAALDTRYGVPLPCPSEWDVMSASGNLCPPRMP